MASSSDLALTCSNFALPSGIPTRGFVIAAPDCLGRDWDPSQRVGPAQVSSGVSVSPCSCGVVGVAGEAAWHRD